MTLGIARRPYNHSMDAWSPEAGEDISDDGEFSPVVASIFDTLLESIHQGRMLPGDRISDARLAEQFRVSRTPVREAIQRLRTLGVVEAAAGRYTRVAEIPPQRTAQAMVVWTALYTALVDEVVGRVPIEVQAAMARDHEEFVRRLPLLDYRAIATTNFLFFGRLMGLSRNPILTDGITRVVHLIRLGSLDLPHSIDIAALAGAQTQLLQAATAGDPRLGREAIESIRAIEIPQE